MGLAALAAVGVGIGVAVQVQQTLGNTDAVDQNSRSISSLKERLEIAEEHSKLS